MSIIRLLSFENIKELLIDPWHVLILEENTSKYFISTYGEHIYNIVEEVTIAPDFTYLLEKLVGDKVIYFASFCSPDDTLVSNSSFFELWREDAYGRQPDEAYEIALNMGLEGNSRE